MDYHVARLGAYGCVVLSVVGIIQLIVI
jgi:hypothetical protein